MTSIVKTALIIGGGFSGMSAAIELRKRGIAVDLVEVDPNWRTDGAGISIGGATLRAFATLGILDRFMEIGGASDGVEIRTPDDQQVAMLPTPRVAGADIPGGAGIMRPVLAKILADATTASGTNVRLGCTFKTINQDADGVDVTFTDGTSGRYDLVVGADGLFSSVRTALFPDAPVPKYSGQGVWRAVVPRPAEVERCIMWVGPKIKIGVNPVSHEEMYLFVTEDRETKTHIPPEEFVPQLKALLAPFSAPLVQWVSDKLEESSLILYRPLEGMLMPLPWCRGRVALVGDTVHATTPHLASGACIGIESAIVLAEELDRASGIGTALSGFQARRWERCRMVVENSGQLGQIEITGGDKAEHARVMRESLLALAQPI